jgi:hypothetical protein
MTKEEASLQAQLDATNTLLDTLILNLFMERPAAFRTAMFTKLRGELSAPSVADRSAEVHAEARDVLKARLSKLEEKMKGPAGADEHDH